MHALLMAAVLTGAGGSTEAGKSPEVRAAAAGLEGELRTGSLIFSQGDCLAVKVFTFSPYTHVGAVVVRAGECVVYESTSGHGVRNLPLEESLARQAPDVIHVLHPRRPLTEEQAAEFERYLESRLGTPYAIKHHVTGKRASGVHCAEYVVDALMCIEVLHAERPAKVSPASLLEGITRGGLYAAGPTLTLERPAPPKPEGQNWCERMWGETKLCCAATCAKLSAWVLCR